MAGFLLAFVLILIVILIISNSVTVRFVHKGEFVIQIDFFLFELLLYPSRKTGKRRKSKGFLSNIRDSFSRATATKKAVDHLLSHSRVTVREFDFIKKTENPSDLALSTQRRYNLISAAVAYLTLKAEAITADNTPYIIEGEAKNAAPVKIDVSIVSTLFNIISSFVIFKINVYKYKRKRGRSIV